MSKKAFEKIKAGLEEAVRIARRDPDAIRKVRVHPSCGCTFCDLDVELREDDAGFHHVAKGERIACTRV